jgi:hypothetical protein
MSRNAEPQDAGHVLKSEGHAAAEIYELGDYLSSSMSFKILLSHAFSAKVQFHTDD